ncbi:Tat pathway signal sequence domain protein [Streptomyces sp. NA04227]|uniref:glycosyl hydrolase family 95 catalytic domain-containing protein n=1 Tax=Streptomyces sp. NA04227 TaxID=2742136 RepID=UPI001590C4DF|nr:Tat pathway signal sequence domain protein [Streptomyces sp. NA04227]QKW10276.1 Tat pathway signal sequence domain protein [Streptomyces sp. NA04227]
MSHPSRRSVLAAGSVVGATALVSGAPSPAGAAAADAAAEASAALVAPPDAWRTVLDDADLVWQKMPKSWDEGPFLGNGFLGTGVYAEPGAETTAVRFTVQHSEVQDHRPEFGTLFGLGRLPVGHFTLEPVGTITALDWRLRLHDAELTGTLTTTAGTLHLRAQIVGKSGVLCVEIRPSEGERDFRWTFHPAESISPRAKFNPRPAGYEGNPPAQAEKSGGIDAAVQPLHAGGQYVTAWHETSRNDTRTLYATVAHSFPQTTARDTALATVRDFSARTYDQLARGHRDWWHTYYRKSFLSFPDTRLQRFYWIQLYKLGCAARRDAPVMATCGPWLEPTPWPATWWNLNVQLEYWLIHGANHLELDAVTRSLGEFRDTMARQMPERYRADSLALPRTTDAKMAAGDAIGIPGQSTPTPEIGNLVWALHNVWLSYRHTMDRQILRDVLHPLLRKAVNYYLHFLEAGPDGKLHLPATYSPEYGGVTRDCNYDLMLLTWGCRTLLDTVRILGIEDEATPRWREVLAKRAAYPTDENGFMIGADIPFAKSHRHYSHLLAVYPLYEITGRTDAERTLIDTSLAHWLSFTGALQGYTYTGAASISALRARGEDAHKYLGDLLAKYIRPNTMYRESGPVIETPLSAAQSIHDMICQSWAGTLHLFPAVPDAWGDISVHNFRTQGAFLVSAAREKGVTRWIRIRSEAGEPCVVRHGIAGEVDVRDEAGRPLRYEVTGEGTLTITLAKGGVAVITARGDRPELTVGPVEPQAGAARWGLPG